MKFLDKNAKIAAMVLPTKLAADELEQATLVLASAVRMTRGYAGQLIQKSVHPIFKIPEEKIDNYPYVITEDHESNPAIPMLKDSTELLLMWALQSKANVKWVYDYAQNIIKVHEVKVSEATMKTFTAYGVTEFETEYKTKTPPPYLNVPKGSIKPDVEASYREALHKLAGVKFLGNDTPAWWSQQLNDKLTAKPAK